MSNFPKQELDFFLTQIIYEVSKILRLENFEFKSYIELMKEISNIDEEITKNIQNFFDAYRAWHRHCFSEDGSDSETEFDEEREMELMEARDAARWKLINSLNR